MDQSESRNLSVTLNMTPEIASELQREQGALDLARAYQIVGSIEEQSVLAVEANRHLQSTKRTITRLRDLKAGFIAPARQIIANAEALFDPAIDACVDAEKYLKGELTRYDADCRRLADEARRKQEEEERRRRQEAEQKAAAERARAEEVARARAKEAAEAETRRQAAEREGNARAAAAAAAAKAKAEEAGRAALENGEAKALEAELAASAQPTLAVVVEQPKLDGFSTRENWVAEFAPGMTEDDVKYALAQAIANGRKDLLPLLKLDIPAANRLAKAQRKNMNAPGLQAVNRPIAASRAA